VEDADINVVEGWTRLIKEAHIGAESSTYRGLRGVPVRYIHIPAKSFK
jgi:hypothetical protein